ncbi:L-2,4-diaminobutyrate decarboxylase [Micromonospora carbonacea]|uniref:L-2,4-diaminobutyrate decarboxylase n=2 Tax=Micromonospora carbonacea TaxID=47853 RepID=A0A1C5ASE7_9ACTN|nr:L-2,4-diaminobutyrate decarboxylase [Micromonospora carbonacea]
MTIMQESNRTETVAAGSAARQVDAVLPPAGSLAGLDYVQALTAVALETLREVTLDRPGPVTAGGPAAVREAARRSLGGPLLPAEPAYPLETFRRFVRDYATWSVDVSHPAAVARMQCPPTPVAAAAELVVGILNQSLHAWESGPYALELERYVIRELGELVGYGPDAGGTITAGGSISNLMAVLAARDRVLAQRCGWRPFAQGLTGLDKRPVVLATDATHFSIGRAVGIVGLGEDMIVRVPSDELGRLLPEELERTLAGLPEDVVPVAAIACVGATDQGWVDDVAALAEVTRRHGVWLHADAAYGGGALFSPRLRPRLDGIAEADSVTLDLHKFGWTSATSGIFLVRDASVMTPLAQQTTTLNADDDAEAGFIGLYGSSVQATRRAEAFKIAVTMNALGRDGMAAMVDGCHDLACYAADRVEAEPALELAARPSMSTVLLRYRHDGDVDAFNGELRRQLMTRGVTLLARTRVRRPDGSSPVFLKLMLLNPATTTDELDRVIDDILATAADLERSAQASR